LHTRWADGFTPYRFPGDAFKSGNARDLASDEGRLTVRQADKIPAEGRGAWQ